MNFYTTIKKILNKLLVLLSSDGEEEKWVKEDTLTQKNVLNIDYDFIKKLEGFETKGYVPDESNERNNAVVSGVTIASGFDLGQHSREEIIAYDFPKTLEDRFLRYVGLRGNEAKKQLHIYPLELTKEEAELVNRIVKEDKALAIAHAFNNDSNLNFFDLPQPIQTVIMSVGFQYGSLPRRTPNFWRGVVNGDWDLTVRNLRNFGDSFKTRRRKEATLLANYLKEKKESVV